MKQLILFFSFILSAFNGNAQKVFMGTITKTPKGIIFPRPNPPITHIQTFGRINPGRINPGLINRGLNNPGLNNPDLFNSMRITSGRTISSDTGIEIAPVKIARKVLSSEPSQNDFLYEHHRTMREPRTQPYLDLSTKGFLKIAERRKKEIEEYFLKALESEIQAEPIRFNFNFEMEEAGDDGATLIIIFDNLNLNVIYYEYKSSVSVA